ncbi:hypothetical protein F5Y00DRAFT_130764 [Daldinia vernicosa]|uniref:uncharacterized protein n=1 Tax=Daldinia vernicosa TaxID=114800 RepID=UPI00200894D2|nr:uncharacterized protein F5Y00DRAFT_130764 [Daldinia vernicosa]KAI0853042.1 hypothetical protein F5Y00DRAFT_130764 [Daldinia vernicosa]
MAEKDMRLRLVVRRDGLPEERLMWNVSLEDNPTISKLIEKVNETFPLEIGQKGLEDYVVELRDQDGTSFECLHFQPVRTVLKPDDRVFIRALDRDDNRRRRISGRHQISSDGRHLVDGIPFGRRLLRAPVGRPPIDPPRKRRKLLHPHESLDDTFNDDEDTPTLLLTNGEPPADKSAFPSVKFSSKSDFIDAETDDGDFDNEAEADDGSDYSEPDDYDQQNSEMPSDEDDLEQELRDLAEDNAIVENKGPSDAQDSTKEDHNKVSALQAAFPSAPVSICEKILATSGDDLKSAYDVLASGFAPQLPESALRAGSTSIRATSKLKSRKSRKDSPTKDIATAYPEEEAVDDITHDNEDMSDKDDEEQVSAFVRQFDHRGLPPGSITSGRGLAQMAAISSSFDSNKASGESETTSTTLNGHKTSPEKTVEEDDTSSDATSSSPESEDSEISSDSDSEDDDSEDEDMSSNSSDHSGNESDDSDDDDGDSNMRPADSSPKSSHDDMSSDSDNESDDSSDDSDDGPEEIPLKRQSSNSQKLSRKGGLGHDNTSDEGEVSSDESSDGESSGAESNSASESEDVEETSNSTDTARTRVQTSLTGSVQTKPSQPPLNTVPQVQLVPPGAGNERTKKRNARRRAANKAKKLAQQGAIMGATSTAEEARLPIIDENALFEAKRQELLNAIASGGIEIHPHTRFDEPSRTSTSTKRKFDEHNEPNRQIIQQDALAITPVTEDVYSSASVQKKLRVDIGAGRRLLFGALGLRNPKTKEDEDKLREKLMEDIRPLDNPRLGQRKDDTRQINEDDPTVEDDLESWKDKIAYRAVECCYEGVQLSEPPFPFVQRWDPQQQNSWSRKKNKRGGQSKRAQRNQGHFYQDNLSSKKRKHEESDMWDEEGYDDTFNGMDDYTNDADVELNYDDTEACQPREANRPINDASQFTDMDDLPSLPSDLSALPALRPGEVQVGMVITWQQWSCSSATSWQPQLSNVTGVVVRIDDDATGLEVCLAKRDRYLDRNQKKYDENTGQRIYDKFEAPDLDDDDDDDEDEGEDEGFRTIGFAEMQQPRILQQPLSIMAPSEKPSATGSLPEASSNTRNEPPAIAEDVKSDAHPERERSSTKESIEENTPGVACVEISSSGQAQQHGDTSASNPSQVNSPSQQLHESISQSVGIQESQLPVQDISSRNIDSDDPSTRRDIEVPGSELPSIRQSSAPLFDSHEDEVVTGTPKVVRSKAVVPPSSVSSARSGRQLDYTLHTEVTEPDSLKMTDDGISTALDTEYQQDLESDEDISTPTPTPFVQEESAAGPETTAQESELRLSAEPSTPSSLSSINTIWCTARTSLTSRNTQSPSKSQSQSQSQSQSLPSNRPQRARAREDQDYEEEMGKLDSTSDYQTSSSRVPDSFERSSQRKGLDGVTEDGVIKAAPNSPPIKTSPPPMKKRRLPKESSQFTLPPGTQVVELSSDSEPVYTENYADDEVDGTYSPDPDSLPKGNGWVHKRTDTKIRNARSVTAPIRPQPPKRRKFISSSQGPLSTSPSTSTSIFSPIKPRRKTSSRF